MSESTSTPSAAARLRERLAKPEILVAVGAHDPLTALIAQRAGVEAVYLGGYSIATHLHGVPDIGLIGFAEVLEVVGRVTAVTSVPVIVDADTGYGAEASVRRTVGLLERAGAAGIQIEDQAWPKRCGHMEGKRLIPRDEMVAKVRAAAEARGSDGLVLIARTDALAVTGIDDAVERANAYAAAGPDLLLVDAVLRREDVVELAQRIEAPMMSPLPPTGSLLLSVKELEQLGYSVALFVTLLGTWLIVNTYRELCDEIMRSQTTGRLLERFNDITELHELTGRSDWEALPSGQPFVPPGQR